MPVGDYPTALLICAICAFGFWIVSSSLDSAKISDVEFISDNMWLWLAPGVYIATWLIKWIGIFLFFFILGRSMRSSADAPEHGWHIEVRPGEWEPVSASHFDFEVPHVNVKSVAIGTVLTLAGLALVGLLANLYMDPIMSEFDLSARLREDLRTVATMLVLVLAVSSALTGCKNVIEGLASNSRRKKN